MDTKTPRSTTEQVLKSVIETGAPLAVGATGIGAAFAPLIPGVVEWAFNEYDRIAQARAEAGLPVVHSEIAALVKSRALTLNPALEIAQAEVAEGIPNNQP